MCKHEVIHLRAHGGYNCILCDHEFIAWDSKPSKEWLEAKGKEKILKEFYGGEELEMLTGEKDKTKCERCGSPKIEWQGTLCDTCRSSLESKNIHGDRYDRGEELEWRKELVLMLRELREPEKSRTIVPQKFIQDMVEKFL